MSFLNDTAEYALRAALYVAQHGSPERPARVEEVATALGIPRNYLSKIMHTYVRNGILASTRGPQGGFWLVQHPSKVTLLKLVEPFNPMIPRRTCVLGRPECSDRHPCPAHSRWKEISENVAGFFRRTTVADLINTSGSLV